MAPVTLTHDQAAAIQDELISEFSRLEFRRKLRDAMDGQEGDVSKQAHTRQALCHSVEGPVLAKYGFEPTPEGLAQHTAALVPLLRDHPDLAARNAKIALLVNPALQAEQDSVITGD